MLIALVSVAVATTLLPVVLATVGPRLDWPRRRREDRASRAWTAWARTVVRRRWAAAGTSVAVLVVLVGAAFSIQLGNPRAESLAPSGASRAAFESLEDSGIGLGPLTPFEALVRGGDPDAVAETLARVEGVQGAAAPPEWRRDGTALVTVIPTEDGFSREGRATLDRVRAAAQTLPAGVTIGSQAAQSSDFVDAVYGNFLLTIGLIAALTFLLLARAFRSLILPLKAVVLNLLSVAAALGVTVLVWQNGLGSEAIWGIEATGSINVEIPIFVFAFLFGLSMDYQVFIISRMREAYDRTGSTQTAVVEGIGRTGRLVTSAALILGLAFVALSASPGTEIKIAATALAAGILLDATIVRAMLVPAVMSILGRWNWWLPHWAARVLKIEASPSGRSPRREPTGSDRSDGPFGEQGPCGFSASAGLEAPRPAPGDPRAWPGDMFAFQACSAATSRASLRARFRPRPRPDLWAGRAVRVLFVNENIGGHGTAHGNLERALADPAGGIDATFVLHEPDFRGDAELRPGPASRPRQA